MTGELTLITLGLAGLVSTLYFRKKLPVARPVFTVVALTGAFSLLTHSFLFGALIALAVERALLNPLWKLLLRFQARPVTPFAGLVLEEARAVTAFRNGRGIAAVVRDGREVQLSARLTDPSVVISAGDRLRIVDVDVSSERLMVTPL